MTTESRQWFSVVVAGLLGVILGATVTGFVVRQAMHDRVLRDKLGRHIHNGEIHESAPLKDARIDERLAIRIDPLLVQINEMLGLVEEIHEHLGLTKEDDP